MNYVRIDPVVCTGCGLCVDYCPKDCQVCFLCEIDCPVDAILVYPRGCA